jgi:hypothetical protein
VDAAVSKADLRLERIPGTPMPTRRGPIWSAAAGAVLGGLVLAGVLMRPTEVVAPIDTIMPTTTVETAAPTTAPTTTATPATTPASVTEPTAPTTTLDTVAPGIEITFPVDGYESPDKTIVFRGTTEPGAVVAAGPYLADVDAEGNWAITLILDVGDTTARFTATDAAGNQSEASVTVGYTPPTTTTKKEIAGFTASFVYGECALTPPYDVYYGKGEPGSTVTVTSEFGGGSTTVGAEGGWELKVEFPEAPPGKTFAVKVQDSYGRKYVFEFTSTVG